MAAVVPVGWVVVEHPPSGLPGLVLPATLHPHELYATAAANRLRGRARKGYRYTVCEVRVTEAPR